MTMRMMPPPTTRQTHRHSRFLFLHPTIIALFLCSTGAYAFTHPITAITLRLSSLLSLSPQHYAPPPPPSPSTSSLSSLQRHDKQLHRYNRRGRVSRLVVALSSSSSSSSESSSTSDNNIIPETFREGEIIGLRYMQDGRHEEALKAFQKAMTLPGSRTDIRRTSNISGPSPVGGSTGGSEGRRVQTLDEFEYQAAHYNMACAHACLNNLGEAILNLQKAFEYGFDNYATVRADPDLQNLDGVIEFDRLMEKVDPSKRRFRNPFDMFGK